MLSFSLSHILCFFFLNCVIVPEEVYFEQSHVHLVRTVILIECATLLDVRTQKKLYFTHPLP